MTSTRRFCFVTALLLQTIVPSLWTSTAWALADQTILSTSVGSDSDSKAVERDAFFIFNTVHHLVRQWGTVYTPNGFSCTRGTIPFGTSLYHGRTVRLFISQEGSQLTLTSISMFWQ